MSKTTWWLLGDINISAKKIKELNEYVLKLLDKGGIRKTQEIILDGKRNMVVKKVHPDKNGLLRFDYSIFEKKKMDECTYDMKTGKLTLEDHGGNEFGMVMNMLMCMLESYSDGGCYLMKNNHLLSGISFYLRLLESVLGKKFTLNNRGRFWEELLFFRNQPDVEDLEIIDVLDAFPHSYMTFSSVQLEGLRMVRDQKPQLRKDEKPISSRAEIAEAFSTGKYDFLCTVMCRSLIQDEEETVTFLRRLLNSDMIQRKTLAERDDDFGVLAELSLYLLPSNIVGAYANAKNMNFWDAWDFFDVNGYKDILQEEETGGTEHELNYELPQFYKVIQRDNEDEFLEFYGDHQLRLSNSLKSRLADWKNKFCTMHDAIKPEEVENCLSSIVSELPEVWRCRYVDKEFVDVMLKNKANLNYRKALLLFRDIMDEDLQYFPELTARQATDWVIQGNRDKYDRIIMMAFQSLIMNEGLRREVLGF